MTPRPRRCCVCAHHRFAGRVTAVPEAKGSFFTVTDTGGASVMLRYRANLKQGSHRFAVRTGDQGRRVVTGNLGW